jgi:glycosyltransferase involved in cell wall biosynthesis
VYAAAGLPPDAQTIVCVGPLEPHKGHRDAIWALDILKYLYDDLYLIMVGEGVERPRLEQFARSIRVADRLRFVGVQPNVLPWLSRAAVVWVPSTRTGGANVTLEAMAAARPVVAAKVPALAETVIDTETGFLTSAGDKVELARRTHALLSDPDLRSSLGDAGRRRALSHFSITSMIDRYADIRQQLAA